MSTTAILFHDIEWDTDGDTPPTWLDDTCVYVLPPLDIIQLDSDLDELTDYFGDMLSDEYGYCVYGYSYTIVRRSVRKNHLCSFTIL